jgi:hypothetical protein
MRSPLPFVWYPAKNLDVGSGVAGYNNMARVVISTLIKEGNEKQPMDTKKGLQIFEELYHGMSLTATELVGSE